MKYLLAVISLALFAAALGNRDYPLALLALALPAVTAVRARLARREEKRNAVIDSATVIEAVLLVWQLASANFRLADPVLFPPPAAILALFFAELGDMLRGLLSSSYLLGSAYGLALVTAIPAGIAVGSSRRLRAVFPRTGRNSPDRLHSVCDCASAEFPFSLDLRDLVGGVLADLREYGLRSGDYSGFAGGFSQNAPLEKERVLFPDSAAGSDAVDPDRRFARADFQFSPADRRRADRRHGRTRLVCKKLFGFRGLRTGDRRHRLYRNCRHFADVAFQQTGAQAAALPEEYT